MITFILSFRLITVKGELQHTMKAIKMRIQKHSRPLVILLAIVVAIITSIVVANATQTITTPNAAFVSYSLASGADSAAITPAANRSVLAMGCNTNGDQAVGQVSLVHIPSNFIGWVGFDSGGVITSGGSSMTGHHIMFIDSVHLVDIQVASRDTIKIHNADTLTKAGNVTLIW